LALGAVVSVCLNSLLILAEWSAVSPNGSGNGLMYSAVMLGGPLIVAILGIPVALIRLIPKKTRESAFIWSGICLSYMAVFLVCAGISGRIRMRAFERLAERSAPLVQAIRKYESDHKYPPDKLADLVPDYLPEIPRTGMGAYPEYEYHVGSDIWVCTRNKWILKVFTPSGLINFDMFVFFPDGNYPEYGFGGYFERVGDWAYCHE